MGERSPYQVLGVGRDASAEEIRRAYREKAKAHHPDVQGGTAREFELVKRAYEVLKDPEARRALEEAGEGSRRAAGGLHYSWANIAAPVQGKGRGRKGSAEEPPGFDELYEAFFQTRIDEAERAKQAEREGPA